MFVANAAFQGPALAPGPGTRPWGLGPGARDLGPAPWARDLGPAPGARGLGPALWARGLGPWALGPWALEAAVAAATSCCAAGLREAHFTFVTMQKSFENGTEESI